MACRVKSQELGLIRPAESYDEIKCGLGIFKKVNSVAVIEIEGWDELKQITTDICYFARMAVESWIMKPDAVWIKKMIDEYNALVPPPKRTRFDLRGKFAVADERIMEEGFQAEEKFFTYFRETRDLLGAFDPDEEDEKVKDELKNAGKIKRSNFARYWVEKALRDRKLLATPSSMKLKGDFFQQEIGIGDVDVEDQFKKIVRVEKYKKLKYFNLKLLKEMEGTPSSFMKKLKDPEEIVGILPFTFNHKLGIETIDKYRNKLKTLFAGNEEVHVPREMYNILKSPKFETAAHMDCHRRPHVTLYLVQRGSTTFHMMHPAIGYYIRFLQVNELEDEVQEVFELMEEYNHGFHMVLEAGEMGVISPAWAHYVFVPPEEKDITSIIAAEFPLKKLT